MVLSIDGVTMFGVDAGNSHRNINESDITPPASGNLLAEITTEQGSRRYFGCVGNAATSDFVATNKQNDNAVIVYNVPITDVFNTVFSSGDGTGVEGAIGAANNVDDPKKFFNENVIKTSPVILEMIRSCFFKTRSASQVE